MSRGTTSELIVTGRSAGDPLVEGDSVVLVQVVNVADSGRREWEVRAVAPGTSLVTSSSKAWSFTIVVGAGPP